MFTNERIDTVFRSHSTAEIISYKSKKVIDKVQTLLESLTGNLSPPPIRHYELKGGRPAHCNTIYNTLSKVRVLLESSRNRLPNARVHLAKHSHDSQSQLLWYTFQRLRDVRHPLRSLLIVEYSIPQFSWLLIILVVYRYLIRTKHSIGLQALIVPDGRHSRTEQTGLRRTPHVVRVPAIVLRCSSESVPLVGCVDWTNGAVRRKLGVVDSEPVSLGVGVGEHAGLEHCRRRRIRLAACQYANQ